MRKLLLAAVALVATAGSPALAQTRAAAGFGPWQTTSGVASAGTPFCALYSAMQGRVGRNVFVKHYGGRDTLSLTMYRDEWLIPRGTDVPVLVDFADNDPRPLRGKGDGHMVEALVPTALVGDFLAGLSVQPVMQVHFPNGGERVWTVPAGRAPTRAAVERFFRCIEGNGPAAASGVAAKPQPHR